jgi:hypothetical protein
MGWLTRAAAAMRAETTRPRRVPTFWTRLKVPGKDLRLARVT